LGYETDTGLFKIGNGSTAWTSLGYAASGASYTAVATINGTTTLTVSSTTTWNFTGTSTQTVLLPAVSTLPLGWSYQILNNSTGNVTVQSSGANNVLVLVSGTSALFTSVATTGTGASVWDYQYSGFDAITGTGSVVLATSPSISAPTITNGVLSGTLTANSSAGTSGQVLSSTGTGVQWVAAGTGAAFSEFLLIGA
jgi:hypothetical protein